MRILAAPMTEEWRKALFRDVAQVSRTRTDPGSLGNQMLTHFSIPSLDASGLPIIEAASGIASHKFKVNQDAVLVSLLNPRIPRVWLAKGGPDVVCSTEFAVLTPQTKSLEVEYLYLMCQSEDFWEELQKRAVGTTGSRQRAKSEGLLSIPAMVPPLPVQRRIVDLMTHLDNHIQLLNEEAASVDALLVTSRALTFASEDSPRVLREVCTLQRGFDLPVQDRVEGKVPIVASNGQVGTHNEFRVQGPGVVTGRSGTIGRVNFLDEDFWPLNTTLFVSDFKSNDPRFIRRLLESMKLQDHAGGSTVPSLNRNVLSEVPVFCPSLEDQIAIAELLDAMELAYSSLTSECSRLSALRSLILTQVVSGSEKIPATYDTYFGLVS